jgi:hypothetical protein
MPVNAYLNYNTPIVPLRNPLIARILSDEYILAAGAPYVFTLSVTAPNSNNGYINFTINDLTFQLGIVNDPVNPAFEHLNIWSGYGVPFDPQTFAAQYLERLLSIHFLYQNFNITIQSVGVSNFVLRFETKVKGPTVALNIFNLPFINSSVQSTGSPRQVRDNFLFNIDVYSQALGSNTSIKIASLYAYPRINPDNENQGLGEVYLNELLYKHIIYESRQIIRSIFPKLMSDEDPDNTIFYPTVEEFSHFIRLITLKYWQRYGPTPVDFAIKTLQRYAFAGGVSYKDLNPFSTSKLVNRWLTNRPMVRYQTRGDDDFLYFMSTTIGVENTAEYPRVLVTAWSFTEQRAQFYLFRLIDQSPRYPFQVWQHSTNFFRLELPDYEAGYPTPITHYTFQIQKSGGANQPYSPLYTVILTDEMPDYSQPVNQWRRFEPEQEYTYKLFFLNAFNVWETLTVHIPLEKTLTSKGEEIERPRTFDNFADELEAQFEQEEPMNRSSYKATTGYADSKENMAFAEELLNAPVVVLCDGKRRIPINIKRESFKVWNDEDFLHSVEFEFTVAHEQRNYDKW